MAVKSIAKVRPPITSETQCIPERTRPVAVMLMRASITMSNMAQSGLLLMYFGRAIITRKKIVVTTIAWVEGKLGSPEPLGRVLRIRNLSKIM